MCARAAESRDSDRRNASRGRSRRSRYRPPTRGAARQRRLEIRGARPKGGAARGGVDAQK